MNLIALPQPAMALWLCGFTSPFSRRSPLAMWVWVCSHCLEPEDQGLLGHTCQLLQVIFNIPVVPGLNLDHSPLVRGWEAMAQTATPWSGSQPGRQAKATTLDCRVLPATWRASRRDLGPSTVSKEGPLPAGEQIFQNSNTLRSHLVVRIPDKEGS